MCLDTITKRYEQPDPTVRKAYKVFSPNEPTGYKFLFYSHTGVFFTNWAREIDGVVPTGEWITAVHRDAWLSGYECGFHAYTKIADARILAGDIRTGLAVVEVELRNMEAEGEENGLPVLVAREMFVPKPKENGR